MPGCSGAAAQAEARCLCSEEVCCLKGAKGVPTHDLIIVHGPIVRTLGKVYPHSLPVIQRFLTHVTSRSRGWPPHQMTRFGCQMPWNGSHALLSCLNQYQWWEPCTKTSSVLAHTNRLLANKCVGAATSHGACTANHEKPSLPGVSTLT